MPVRSRSIARALGSLALLPALAGCSSYSSPTLQVSEARVVERSPEASVVHFTIAAQNANDVELPLRSITYTLARGGRPVFSGLRSPEATLRRIGTQTFTIPAVIPASEAAGPQSYTLQGTLEYITPGSIAQVLFDTGVRRPNVAFSEEVSLDLSAPAPAAPQP
jgi:hypothetical protein